MKFLVCLALLVAAASAGYAPALYNGGYSHGLGLAGYGGYGYGGYGHGLGYAAPIAHAPIVKAVAPVATSYANVNSVHLGQHVIARPVAHGYYGASPVGLGHGLGYGGYGHGLGYASTYGHGLAHGYNAYHY